MACLFCCCFLLPSLSLKLSFKASFHLYITFDCICLISANSGGTKSQNSGTTTFIIAFGAAAAAVFAVVAMAYCRKTQNR